MAASRVTCVSFEEILRAADDEGMLVAFSQPHFGQYDWKAANADQANGYALHAAFFVQAAQNHPAVVAYAMSHNATGYEQDMNPDLIDGIRDMHADSWSARNAKLAVARRPSSRTWTPAGSFTIIRPAISVRCIR